MPYSIVLYRDGEMVFSVLPEDAIYLWRQTSKTYFEQILQSENIEMVYAKSILRF